MRVICSGGGSGGHIFPAIAVAQELKRRNSSTELLFIGAKGKMEMIKVPKAGFKIEGLWISGFQRRLTIDNALFPIKLGSSIIKARSIIGKFDPDVVAGFGGYASGAALWTANKMGIPTLIQEQNSYPGITNKILGRSVDTVCTAYAESGVFFDGGPKLVLTGNPVRDMSRAGKDMVAARDVLGLSPNMLTVLIIGGSQGARSLNEVLSGSTVHIAEMKEVQFFWQCGAGYYKDYKDSPTAQLDNVRSVPFIEDMDLAYAASDIVICRAGALTISELMILGKPAILVPSPNVAEDHQTKNALALVNEKAAFMVKDHELHSRLWEVLHELLKSTELREKLSSHIRQLARPNATQLIVNELEILANK